MLQFGLSVEETTKSIQALADTTAALKLAPDTINSVSETFARMNQQIVATTRSMRTLTNEGIPAWQALADKIGTSVPEAMERVKAGLISSQTVIDAVTDTLENRYGGAAEKAAQTWIGATSQMTKAFEEVMVAVGRAEKAFLNDLAPAVTFAADAIREFAKWITALPDPVKNAAIAFGVLAVGIAAATAAWIPFTAALATVAGFFSAPILAAAALVAGLAFLGTWIHENWEPITAVLKQAWEGLSEMWADAWNKATAFLEPVLKWMTDTFAGPLLAAKEVIQGLWNEMPGVWAAIWSGIVSYVQGAAQAIWDVAKALFGPIIETVQSVIGWFAQMAGSDKLASLGATWSKEKTAADSLADANKKLTDTRNADQEAASAQQKQTEKNQAALTNYSLAAKALGVQTTQELQERVKMAQTAEAAMQQSVAAGIGSQADLVAAHQAVIKAEKDATDGSKNLTEAHNASAEAAKKAAAAHIKYADDVQAAYKALEAASPALAESLKASLGGIPDDVSKASAVLDPLRSKLDATFLAAAKSALDLEAAMKSMGVTSQSSMEATANAADKTFNQVAAAFEAGTRPIADYRAALDSMVAAHQKIADSLNKDLADAFKNGKITADEYYQGLVDRAQKAYDDLVASNKATDAQLLASQIELGAAQEAQAKNASKEIGDAYHALGLKTEDELTATATKWTEYANTVAQVSGDSSKAALEARLKALDAEKAALEAAGKTFTDEDQRRYQALKEQLDAMTPAAQRLTDAFQALGVQSQASLVDSAQKAAGAMATVNEQMVEGKATAGDLYLAQQKVTSTLQALADQINQRNVDAFKAGKMSADDFKKSSTDAAQAAVDAMKKASDGSVGSINAIIQAQGMLQASQNTTANNAQRITDAYHAVGLKTKGELDDQIKYSQDSYDLLVAQGGQYSEAALKTEVDLLKAKKQAHSDYDEDFTKADQQSLDDATNRLKKFSKTQSDVWDAFYKALTDATQKGIQDVFDRLIMGGTSGKSIWQDFGDIATTALKSIESAFTKLASQEVIGLLTGKVTDLGSLLTDVSSKMKDLLGLGADAASSAGSAASGAAGAAGSAGNAAGSVASAVGSSLTGIIGAVGSVVSAISSVIGNFQMAHQETSLNAIEHNTRYTMMYVGDRSDGGILGQAFQTNELLGWGPTVKATQALADMFPSHLDALNDISSNTYWTLQKCDASLGKLDTLIDIGNRQLGNLDSLVAAAADTSMALKSLQITVTATGATTKEAAQAMGDQIAANLSDQLVGSMLR